MILPVTGTTPSSLLGVKFGSRVRPLDEKRGWAFTVAATIQPLSARPVASTSSTVEASGVR